MTGTWYTVVNKADLVPAFGKPLIWWVGQAVEWTVKRLDALMRGYKAGTSNPIREGWHSPKENDIQAQSYRRSKREPHSLVKEEYLRQKKHMEETHRTWQAEDGDMYRMAANQCEWEGGHCGSLGPLVKCLVFRKETSQVSEGHEQTPWWIRAKELCAPDHNSSR